MELRGLSGTNKILELIKSERRQINGKILTQLLALGLVKCLQQREKIGGLIA